jgi:hypothetical protein
MFDEQLMTALGGEWAGGTFQTDHLEHVGLEIASGVSRGDCCRDFGFGGSNGNLNSPNGGSHCIEGSDCRRQEAILGAIFTLGPIFVLVVATTTADRAEAYGLSNSSKMCERFTVELYLVEFASNCVWVLVSVGLLAWTWRAWRAKTLSVGGRTAFTLVALICLLLLPVISISDDLLEARQATLPASAQTWHMASQDISSAVEILPILIAFLSILHLIECVAFSLGRWNPGRNVATLWLTRSHSLRPPPAPAI